MPVPALLAATLPSIIGAAGSIGASWLGSAAESRGIADTNALNLQIARENRDWQERMDNTKYQRGVADARAAGFNPLVAFPGSAGTPIPSTPVMQNPNPNRGELYLATAKALAEIRLTNKMAETEDTKQEANRAQASASRGVISIPGVGTVPIDRVTDALKALNDIQARSNAKDRGPSPVNWKKGRPDYEEAGRRPVKLF